MAKKEEVQATNKVEDQVKQAKEVDQGESARELLEQALPYVNIAGYKDYSGNPEYAANSLRDRIEAFLVLNKK